MTYNPRLAKVKVDSHAKNQRQVKQFKQESAHSQTDTHTSTHMDATKHIISPATRSIITMANNVIHTGWDRDGDSSPLNRVTFAITLDTRGLYKETSAVTMTARRPHHKWTCAYCLLNNIRMDPLLC